MPRVGRIGGGTPIVVTGFIPDVGVEVHIESSDGIQSVMYTLRLAI